MRRSVRVGLASGLALLLLAALGPSVAAEDRVPATLPGVSTLGTSGWRVLTSATATQGGATISTPGFDTSGWLGRPP